MKLYYSQNSPFSRVARIAARESGLMHLIAEQKAASRQPDNPVLEHSHVGRVPTLVDGNSVITEARYVFNYLAEKSETKEMQALPKPNWLEIMQEGQILGFVDGIACWVRENRREPVHRSSFLIQVEKDRSQRCLTYLEKEAADEKLSNFPNFRSIALATGLDLMHFHQFHRTWQADHPRLSSWFEVQSARPSMNETAPL